MGAVACAPPVSNAMPVVVVQPGYVERIALMDKYRVNDEDRKHMMARPHVWVEEASDDDAPDSAEQPEAATEQPPPEPTADASR
jgi:hypothetical protein